MSIGVPIINPPTTKTIHLIEAAITRMNLTRVGINSSSKLTTFQSYINRESGPETYCILDLKYNNMGLQILSNILEHGDRHTIKAFTCRARWVTRCVNKLPTAPTPGEKVFVGQSSVHPDPKWSYADAKYKMVIRLKRSLILPILKWETTHTNSFKNTTKKGRGLQKRFNLEFNEYILMPGTLTYIKEENGTYFYEHVSDYNIFWYTGTNYSYTFCTKLNTVTKNLTLETRFHVIPALHVSIGHYIKSKRHLLQQKTITHNTSNENEMYARLLSIQNAFKSRAMELFPLLKLLDKIEGKLTPKGLLALERYAIDKHPQDPLNMSRYGDNSRLLYLWVMCKYRILLDIDSILKTPNVKHINHNYVTSRASDLSILLSVIQHMALRNILVLDQSTLREHIQTASVELRKTYGDGLEKLRQRAAANRLFQSAFEVSQER